MTASTLAAVVAAAGLTTMTSGAGPARADQKASDQQLAALASAAPAPTCLSAAEVAPAVRIVACTIAIDEKMVNGSELGTALLHRGQAYRAVGDRSRAQADYEGAVKQFDARTDSSELDSAYYVRRAVALHGMGDATRALADYDEAIRLDTGNALAHVDRGILLATRKAEMTRAIGDFTRALELVPDNVDTLVLRADAYLTVGQIGKAKADADRAVQLAPNSPQAFVVRGLVHARMKDQAMALADYSEAIRLEPRHVDALVNRGAILSLRGDYDGAIRDLDAALAVAPANALAAYNRGYAFFGKRDYERAIRDYTTAIEADGRMGWAYGNRCLSRSIVGRDLPEAVADCDRALELMPDNVEVRETRGFIYLKMGKRDAAAREYEVALRNDPNRPLALYGRGAVRVAGGDVKGGKADQAAARALLPGVDQEFSIYGIK